jgi:type IV pilus modification protein PilV
MNREVLKSQNGFTLIELLVAVLLMSIGIFAVIGMQTFAINGNSIAMKYSVASSLAQEALEDILSWKSDDTRITKSVANAVYDLEPDPAKTSVTSVTIPGAGTYNATYTTTVGPAAGIPYGVTKVTVTVTGGGKTVTVTGFKRTV